MPTGYVSPCPDLILPLTQWIVPTWVVACVLCTETLVLGLELLVFRLRKTIPRYTIVSMSAVIGCALAALALGLWMVHRNAQFCGITPHYTPEWGAQVAHAVAIAIEQAHIAIATLITLLIMGTALTAATLVRGWRQGS